MSYSGIIHLILGPMYSGKTTELLRLYRRYQIAKKNCVIIKYGEDQRYHTNKVVTHDNVQYESLNAILLSGLFKMPSIERADVICIDEIQFYNDAPDICDMWANNGKIVIASGLNGDFKREPFDVISKLLPKAEEVTFLTAICNKTGEPAAFSKRISDEKQVKVIGGVESYVAACRMEHFN